MEKILISVVIPIYNVQKYLRRCLDSIINQTYRDIEILLINDGSTDKSLEICREYLNKDKRIKLISKKNEGLGMARNTGIDNATGEYVCFFDSDDFIATDTIEKLYNVIEREKTQIVCYGFCSVSSSGKILKRYIPNIEKVYFKDTEVINEFLPELITENPDTGISTNLNMSAWASIYSLKLIKDSKWKFVSERDIISEDIYSLLKLYKDVKSVYVLKDVLYFYCENDQSLTHTYREDRYKKIEYFYIKSRELIDELKYPNTIKRRLAYPFLGNTISALKQITNSKNKLKNKLLKIEEIINNNTLQGVLRECKENKFNFSKKILFFFMRKKKKMIIYLLILMKSNI